MSRTGLEIDETIIFPGDGVGAAARQLTGVLAAPGFTVAPVPGDTAGYVFTRAYRPLWSVVLGVLLAPTVIGLLLLLVRVRERCQATMRPDLRGVSVHLSGRLPSARLAVLRGLAGAPAQPRPTGPASRAVAALADVWVASDAEPTVVAAGPGVAAGEPASVLVFDTGQTAWLRSGSGLVGRAPEPEPGESVDQVVTVADPSVSKTHFGFGLDWLGVWIMDRESRNGCIVVDESGLRTTCEPGQRVSIRPGMTVLFGSRSCVLRLARSEGLDRAS